MADEVAKRDEQRTTVALGVTDDTTKALAMLRLDPTTLRLKVLSNTTLSNIEYTEGATDTTITGVPIMWEDSSDTLRAVSSAKPLPISAATLETNTDYFRDIDITSISYVNDQISQFVATDGTKTKTLDFTRNASGQVTAIASTIS